MSDYDLIVVGSGFAGSSATLAFCEAAEKEGRSGRVALLEVGKEGERAGASRWTMAYLRLTPDNRLSSEWKERMEQQEPLQRVRIRLPQHLFSKRVNPRKRRKMKMLLISQLPWR